MARPVRHHGKWRIRWIDETGKRRSEVYDGYKDALLSLQRRQLEAEEIRRGLRRPEPPDRTINELAQYWLEKRAPQKRSSKDDESILRAHLVPAFGRVRVRDLTVAHIDQYRALKEHLHPKTVSNHLTLLISLLNLAKDLRWVTDVPRIRKPKVRMLSADFRYLRTEAEMRRFLNAAHAEGDNVHVLYATAVYTGMRAGELAGLVWEDVDFEKRLITVQRSFAGPTKSRRRPIRSDSRRPFSAFSAMAP